MKLAVGQVLPTHQSQLCSSLQKVLPPSWVVSPLWLQEMFRRFTLLLEHTARRRKPMLWRHLPI